MPAAKAAFVARCRDRGWQTAIVWEADEFVRLSVIGADDKIEVDLGIDASLILPPTVTFLGPTIGLEENAGRKTLALFGRAAPRDFVDVFNLAQRFGKPKLLELAAERDLGFDRRVFGQMARMVNQINARQFPLDEGSVPDLVAFFNGWSEELRVE
ncbi:MAG: nucleotidyl transferase AbiEii/AbiGii toxin family protein [Actinomycetota bacterium]|nr:nucleotidyl transferase AbiEii/AbiGii toxin family protein [Actinomycetota bacterium]